MAATIRNSARQASRWAYVNLVLANLVSAADLPVIEVPQNAVIVSGAIITSEVFNSTSTDVLDVGDSGSENRYKNDASIAALGLIALVPTGYVYTAPSLITVRWVSGGGSPTTGKFRLQVEYVVLGRSDTHQGQDYGARLA